MTNPADDAGLRSDLQRLVAETRDAYEPPSSSRARVHWAIEQRLSAGEASRFAARRRVLLAALALGLVSAGATAALVGSWNGDLPVERTGAIEPGRSGPPSAPVAPAAAGPLVPSALPSSTDVGADEARRSEIEVGSGAGQRARTRAAAPRVDARESLRAELDLLRAVNAAQRSGDPATALRLLESFTTEQGPGVLIEERDAARIVALCSLGRIDEGRARLLRFEARFPTSPQLARVRSQCAE